MTEWRPIETAPKDGTDIRLLFDRECWLTKSREATGFWSTDADDWPEVDPWFQDESDSAPLTAFGEVATHWRSLSETELRDLLESR